jgi:hypothetical protein
VGVFRPHLFSGEKQVNAVSWSAAGAFEKHFDAQDLASDEAGRFERCCQCIEVGATHQDIDILCIAHGSLINARNPRRHGVSAYNRVRNSCLLKSGCCSQHPLADFFHGAHHAFEGNRAN